MQEREVDEIIEGVIQDLDGLYMSTDFNYIGGRTVDIQEADCCMPMRMPQPCSPNCQLYAEIDLTVGAELDLSPEERLDSIALDKSIESAQFGFNRHLEYALVRRYLIRSGCWQLQWVRICIVKF